MPDQLILAERVRRTHQPLQGIFAGKERHAREMSDLLEGVPA